MNDITIIYLTASLIPEKFAEYQRSLLKSYNLPIISVSRKPLDFGLNLIDTEPKRISNIYFQMLRAAKLATTEFVAVAEDDVLYPEEHFTLRTDKDTFTYNQNRYVLFTWGVPTYSWKPRRSNATLIAPRELLIESLEERFAKWPDGTPDNRTGELGRGMIERNLGITERKSADVYTTVSVVQLNHAMSSEKYQVNQRKRMGYLRAYSIPVWGEAKDVVKKFYDN
jgi:hypothetical protein